MSTTREPVTVSVILAVYNEREVLEPTLASLLDQELPPGFELEILVIDGNSTDGSSEVASRVGARDSRVRLLHNAQRVTPVAFNLGLRAAAGEFVAILGAHCTYAPGYLACCLRELARRNAVGCSGRVITRPAGASLEAMLSYWTLVHRFGVSGASFRTQPEGYVDSIPFPVFRKQALLQLGGYDETMVRNQDNDMNYRLRRAGYSLYRTGETWCEYRARPNLAGLWAYARSNGFWCGISWRRTPRSLGLRHYAPAAFLLWVCAGLLALPLASLGGLGVVLPLAGLAPLAVHLTLGHLAAADLALRERHAGALLMPWVFLRFHLLYGSSFFRGAMRARG